MPIRKLPPLLVNQIAAGEVIERPASVVKELVENCLDAGATRISVAIEEGGQQLIRVSDDGRGIPPDELALAVAPHATSKLQTTEQLAAIETLGFRGEAVASIASVSRFRITSRPIDAEGRPVEAGAQIEAAGDQVSDVCPAACSPGTTVEVRDLFFNTPARRKFMRTASTEFGHISELLQRVAMVHHRIGFRLSHNGRNTLDLPPEQSRARRCIELLGKDLEEGLLEFSHEELNTREEGEAGEEPPRPVSVWGMAGLPELARATGKFQYLCVNGRPIRDRALSHAVREAYRGLCPPDRHPMAVVFLDLDPRMVDVNVHPAKSEVRFRNPSAVHGLVLNALRQRLLGADLTPRAEVRDSGGTWGGGGSEGGGFGVLSSGSGTPSAQPEVPDSKPDTPTVNGFVDYFKRMDPTQKGFAFSEVRRALQEESPEAIQAGDEGDAAEPILPRSPSSFAPSHFRPILQVHQSYVVTQDDEGLLIVDQHALHERVMFEELRRRVLREGKTLESQRLLMPAVIDADAAHLSALEDLQPLLQRIGIEAAPMGPKSVGVQAFPSFLFDRGVEPEVFLRELLDKVAEGDLNADAATADEAALHEVLDMMACKAAVKAGDGMSDAELAALLDKRHEVERSSNCPHGRPTTLRLTLRDLERQFGRT